MSTKSTIVEIKERGLTTKCKRTRQKSTIVEIKERGLTVDYAVYSTASTIVEIKERGLTHPSPRRTHRRIYNSRN